MVCVCGRQTCEEGGCSIRWYHLVRGRSVGEMGGKAFCCSVLSVPEV